MQVLDLAKKKIRNKNTNDKHYLNKRNTCKRIRTHKTNKYRSGPFTGTLAYWKFPDSGTKKGVRDFEVPKSFPCVTLISAFTHVNSITGSATLFN